MEKFDVLRLKWKQFRKEIDHHWSQFNSDDLDRIGGRRDNLVRMLQTRYGYTRKRVERVVTEFEDRLRRAF